MEGSSHAKISSIRSAVSIELRLVTDRNRQTDRRTQGHGYSTRASIASSGQNAEEKMFKTSETLKRGKIKTLKKAIKTFIVNLSK